jgi:hypothetical protein
MHRRTRMTRSRLLILGIGLNRVIPIFTAGQVVLSEMRIETFLAPRERRDFPSHLARFLCRHSRTLFLMYFRFLSMVSGVRSLW